MTSKKKIFLQAAVASLGLGFIGVTFNTLSLTARGPSETTLTADRVTITTESRPRPPEDVRIAEERERRAAAAPRPEPGTEPPMGDEVLGEVEPMIVYMEEPEQPLTRGEAMRRVEDIHHELEGDLYPHEREALEWEMTQLLAEHFPTAAAEDHSVPIPKNGDSNIMSQLDINNVFNKFWGLLQAIIVAWIPYKLNQKKKQDLLTNSVMDRIDEELVERHRRKYTTNKHKVE
jgi:hypothetical protein